MATPTYPPHPLLEEPVLYVADPPKHVQWAHLKQMFDRCGKVIYDGLCFVHDPRLGIERQYYPVYFADLFEAEMALATLQGETVDGVDPPWSLVLSHSPTLEPAFPTSRRWPQRVIPNIWSADNQPNATTAQTIFRWFRPIGPLVFVGINMVMGNSESATVIEYWDKAHSEIAALQQNLVHTDIYLAPRFSLPFFDPCSLRCLGVVGQTGEADEHACARKVLMAGLTVFGEITRAYYSKLEKGLELDDIVTFMSAQSAAWALSAMEVSNIRYYHRFEYYDGPELPSESSEWPAPDPVPSRSLSPSTKSSASMDNATRTQSSTPHSPDSHPLLSRPILYIANPPNHVVWGRLKAEFSSRGYAVVQNLGQSAVEGKPGSFKWAIGFKKLKQAEKALATMHETWAVKSGPRWMMMLSHSPTLTTSAPAEPIFSQYLQTDPTFFSIKKYNVTIDEIYKLFRKAGPLVSVRMNVGIGNKVQTAVVQYWYEDHANMARITYTTMNQKKKRRPPFSLRTFDPCGLRCSGFGPLVTPKDLEDAFSRFGAITSTTLDVQKSGTHGIVTFSRPTDAARALQAMDNTHFRGRVLKVRYDEPGAQHVFRRPSKPSSSPPGDSGGTTGATADVPPPRPSPERLRREAHARELKEAAERRAKEASARATAEAKVNRRQETLRRKEELERINAQAKQDIEAAMMKRQAACDDLDLARQIQEMADQELADMRESCAEAKRIWLEAMDREVAAARKARDALEISNEALTRRQDAEASIKFAQQQEMISRIEAQTLETELSQDELDEETLRQAELADSIRRMEELRKLEQTEKEEEARKEKQEAEEILRREREEAERLRREQREREDKARQDAETRQRLYKQAVAKEQARCRLRDMQFCPNSFIVIWHEQRALERFKLVSDEFDSLKFQESQPLTFDCVPWPILVQPRHMTFDAIDWSAVEQFFNAMEKLLQDQAEYKILVEKAHRRFHPDKWRARGLLSSVWDDDLRGKLEAAGNVVAQAITPLWVKTRQPL